MGTESPGPSSEETQETSLEKNPTSPGERPNSSNTPSRESQELEERRRKVEESDTKRIAEIRADLDGLSARKADEGQRQDDTQPDSPSGELPVKGSERVNVQEWLGNLEKPDGTDQSRRDQLSNYLNPERFVGMDYKDMVSSTLDQRKELAVVEERLLNQWLQENLPNQINDLLSNPKLLVMSYAPDRRTGEYRSIGEELLDRIVSEIKSGNLTVIYKALHTRHSQLMGTLGRIHTGLQHPDDYKSPAPSPEGTPKVDPERLVETEEARYGDLRGKVLSIDRTLYAFKLKGVVPLKFPVEDPHPGYRTKGESELDSKNWKEVLEGEAA